MSRHTSQLSTWRNTWDPHKVSRNPPPMLRYGVRTKWMVLPTRITTKGTEGSLCWMASQTPFLKREFMHGEQALRVSCPKERREKNNLKKRREFLPSIATSNYIGESSNLVYEGWRRHHQNPKCPTTCLLLDIKNICLLRRLRYWEGETKMIDTAYFRLPFPALWWGIEFFLLPSFQKMNRAREWHEVRGHTKNTRENKKRFIMVAHRIELLLDNQTEMENENNNGSIIHASHMVWRWGQRMLL